MALFMPKCQPSVSDSTWRWRAAAARWPFALTYFYGVDLGDSAALTELTPRHRRLALIRTRLAVSEGALRICVIKYEYA